MTMSDPVGDLITRLRNAVMARKATVSAPASGLKENVLAVLQEEGYIESFARRSVRQGVDTLDIELKYHEGRPVIRNIRSVSKPGRRVYSSLMKLKPVFNGLGVSILSTSRGVMSDRKAKQENVSGEVLFTVF